jgi:hypothetical protein
MAFDLADLNNGDIDLQKIQDFVNSDAPTFTTRFGKVKPTLAGTVAKFEANAVLTQSTQARDVATAIVNRYATTAAALSNGVAAIASVVAGSGGANGTFDLAFTGGAGSGAAGKFIVVGGAVTQVLLTAKGSGYTSAPTVSFAASSGLAGASATAVISINVPAGQFFSTPSPVPGEAALIWQNVAGVAVLSPSGVPSTAAFNSVQSSVTAQQGAVITIGSLAVGWKDPADFVGMPYRNDFNVKFYCDGLRVYPMMPDDTAITRPEWRRGGLRVRHPVDGLYYVSISLARRYDPTLQGASFVTRYVDNVSGNDTTGDGQSWATAFRTVEKVEAVMNADGVNNVYQCFVRSATFIGGNGAGWTNATHNINASKQLKVVGVGQTKPWWLPGMRNSFTKASFAWADMGNGIWRSTAGANAASRRTKVVFDLSVLDANGMPTPSESLAGPYADEAAILAAMAGKPTFHTTASEALYVKLASGAEPDPGLNFAYNELGVVNLFAIEEGGRLMIENIRACHNAGTASNSTLFSFRPKTYTQGASEPNVQHNNRVVLKDCEIYGSSGNGYSFLSISRAIVEDCKDGFCWLDGVNSHSLYSYPANSSSTDEGLYQHTWVDGHLSLFHGPNGFSGQPGVNASSNCYTDHDRGRGTILNSRGGFSNGSAFALVGGAKWLALNTNIFEPKYVVPAVDTYQAAYLSSGVAAGVPSDGSEIWLIDCTGNVRRGNGTTFYAGAGSKVIAAEYRGKKTKQLIGTGTVLDGDGNAV